MIFQNPHGYKNAKALFLKGKSPIHTIYRKEYYEAMREEHQMLLAQIGEPIHENWEPDLLNTLTKLRHHDEYFNILDMRKMEVEWTFGLSSALGYAEEEEKNWTLHQQHNLIHETYYPTFLALGFMMNQVLREKQVLLKALGQRYIINIPLRKKNGSYVWVKQMSVPLSLDKNGLMARQLNSYTIISGYAGVSLPFLPRAFYADGSRAKDVEKALFTMFVEKSLFKISPTQRRVAQAALEIWKQKIESARDSNKRETSTNAVVTHEEVSQFMRLKWGKIHQGIMPGTVRNHVDTLKGKTEKGFGIRFPNVVETALFLRNLYCLED
jgi:hypothetical protein